MTSCPETSNPFKPSLLFVPLGSTAFGVHGLEAECRFTMVGCGKANVREIQTWPCTLLENDGPFRF